VTALGPALGFFIGVICGLAVLLLIRTAQTARATLKTTVAEISQLLAIPTFSFGGPWVTSGELAFLLGQERRNKAKPPGPA
jgi:hypothetical protein